MYGTVARLKVKPGKADEVIELFEEWDRELKPRVDGAIGGYTYQLESDPNVLFVTAIFRDRQAYFANADNPEQDKWYRRVRDLLEADPEWNDGEIVQGG